MQWGGCGAPGAAARRHARLIRAPLGSVSPLCPRARPLKRTALLAKPMNGINAPQRPDCVADDAVSCELVSAPNSLLTGKLTGNFANSGPQQRFPHLINEPIQRLAAKFPTQRNRNFCSHNREFFRDNREFNRASSESAELLLDVELARPLMSTPGTSAA